MKGVSRRREKKKRLRRDARVGSSRGNQRADFGNSQSLAIRLLYFLRRPGSALGTPDLSPACLFVFRESTILCHFFLCALCANPVFHSRPVGNRLHAKQGRLRRDARVGSSRGKWFLRPRDPPFVFFAPPRERLGTPDFSQACLFFFRENTVLCHFFLCALCAL